MPGAKACRRQRSSFRSGTRATQPGDIVRRQSIAIGKGGPGRCLYRDSATPAFPAYEADDDPDAFHLDSAALALRIPVDASTELSSWFSEFRRGFEVTTGQRASRHRLSL
jgi:hypothetical protein